MNLSIQMIFIYLLCMYLQLLKCSIFSINLLIIMRLTSHFV